LWRTGKIRAPAGGAGLTLLRLRGDDALHEVAPHEAATRAWRCAVHEVATQDDDDAPQDAATQAWRRAVHEGVTHVGRG